MQGPRRHEIQLDCGISIKLTAFNQYCTYEGLLEGLPTKGKNAYQIESAVESARSIWGDDPHLIPPIETPIVLDHEYPFGEPASIPGVVCLGRWRSQYQPPGQDLGCTELSIVWFQSEFGLPTDEKTLKDLKQIDWEFLAKFREF